MTPREKLDLLRSYRAAGGTGSYTSLLKEAKSYDAGGPKKKLPEYGKFEPITILDYIETEFRKQEIKEVKMNRKFPFYLNPDVAEKIVDIACSSWKTKLATRWSVCNVLNKQIEITEAFYKEMRSACTKEQHQLFDDIFGKDEPTYQYTDGELVWVKSGITRPWFLRYTTGKITDSGYLMCYDDQQKSGSTTAWFGHQPAPGIKLPD